MSDNDNVNENAQDQVVNESVVDDNEIVDEELTNDEGLPPTGENPSEKIYSTEDVSRIVAQRLARLKSHAIESKVQERVQEIEKEKVDLIEKLKESELEIDVFKTENDVLGISFETGISDEILRKSSLKGDALRDFAVSLAEEKKSWSNGVSADSILNNAAISSSGKKEKTWRDALTEQIKGEE